MSSRHFVIITYVKAEEAVRVALAAGGQVTMDQPPRTCTKCGRPVMLGGLLEGLIHVGWSWRVWHAPR